jgi:hypothetical protein
MGLARLPMAASVRTERERPTVHRTGQFSEGCRNRQPPLGGAARRTLTIRSGNSLLAGEAVPPGGLFPRSRSLADDLPDTGQAEWDGQAWIQK